MIRPTHSFTNDAGETTLIHVPEGETAPEGAVALAPDYFDASDLETAKGNLWFTVKAKRLAVEQGGADTPLGRMDTDADSQAKINGAVTMALVANATGAPFALEWTMSDNSKIAHDGPAMIAAGVAVGQHVAACHDIASALREAIEAASTVADVEAVDIGGAEWPGA